jgi:Uma2 family endonuclease
VVVPDLAAWRRERMPVIPDVPYFTLAPDWVCEVVSPGTEALDRVKKRGIYAREGVAHLWLVNPLPMTVEVYALTGASWLLHASHHGSVRVRLPPFDAVELDLGRWWLSPPSE